MRQRFRDYRFMLWLLREHEGWRAWRWPAASVCLFSLIWAVPLAGATGSVYLGQAGHGFGWIVLSAAVALGLGNVGGLRSKARPWRRFFDDRLAAYEQQADARDYALARVRGEDFHAAMHSLRRAGLNGTGRSTQAPPDAPYLTLSMNVYRPAICVRPGQGPVSNEARRILRVAGVEARVDGLLADGEPIPTIATGVVRA